MLITCVILMMIDVVMHGQGRVTWRTTRVLLIKLFCQPICICSGVVVLAMEVIRFWVTITRSFMVQTPKILTDAYTSRVVRGQSTLKDVVERYFWNGLSRERLKPYMLWKPWKPCVLRMPCMPSMPMSWLKNVHLLKKAKSEIWNLKPNCIYSMQSIEQHYFHETEEQNSNGCKLNSN